MPREIEMPDGSIVEFPDDFSDDKISEALESYEPFKAPTLEEVSASPEMQLTKKALGLAETAGRLHQMATLPATPTEPPIELPKPGEIPLGIPGTPLSGMSPSWAAMVKGLPPQPAQAFDTLKGMPSFTGVVPSIPGLPRELPSPPPMTLTTPFVPIPLPESLSPYIGEAYRRTVLGPAAQFVPESVKQKIDPYVFRAAEQAKGMAEFAESPLGVATAPIAGGALGKTAQTLLGLLFAADMGRHIPEQYRTWRNAEKFGTDKEKAQARTDLAFTIGMPVAIVAKIGHEYAKGPTVTPEAEVTLKTPAWIQEGINKLTVEQQNVANGIKFLEDQLAKPDVSYPRTPQHPKMRAQLNELRNRQQDLQRQERTLRERIPWQKQEGVAEEISGEKPALVPTSEALEAQRARGIGAPLLIAPPISPQISEPEKTKTLTERKADAIQERGAEKVPVDARTEVGKEVGARIPKPKELATPREEKARAEPAPQEGATALGDIKSKATEPELKPLLQEETAAEKRLRELNVPKGASVADIKRQNTIRDLVEKAPTAHQALKSLVDEGHFSGLNAMLADKLVSLGDFGIRKEIGGKRAQYEGLAAGSYNPATDTVHVYDAAFNSLHGETTVLHEYVHGLTHEALRVGVLNEPLEKLWKSAFDAAEAKGEKFYGVSSRHLQGKQQKLHLHEFITEALSNEKFQEFLKKNKSPIAEGTLWNQFVEWVGKIFGIEKGSNLYDTLNIAMDLVESRKKPTKEAEAILSRKTPATELLSEVEERQKLTVGPGAARPADIGVKSDLTELTGALKSVTSEKVPLTQQVKDSLEISKRGAKNALESAWGGMKGSAAYLWDKVANPPQWDSFKEAVGKWDLQNQQTSFENRKFVQQLNKTIPSRQRRAAIRKWIDAGGDATILKRGAAETKPEFRKMYEDALNLNPDELNWARNVQQYFESMADKGIEAGLFDNVLEDYIHRAYPKESNWKNGVISEIKSGLLQQNPSLAKQRFYRYDFEAEKAGLTPIHDVGESLALYDQAFRRALSARTFVKSLMDLTEKDGRPTIDVAGIGVPVEKAGVTEATLVRPKFKTGGTGPLNNRKDYVAYDHPALRRWKWVETGKEGQPIFVQGDVLVHPDAYKKLDALLGRSWWQKTPARRALIKAGSTVKQTMLDLSGFHAVQIGTHALEHKVNPLKLVDIDFTNPVQRDLISHGLVASDTHAQSLYSEGLAGTALTRRIPWVGDRLSEYNDWLFKEYIPRIKMTMALGALERNAKRYPNFTHDQLLKLTSDQANAAFGELNYRMMGRHPSTQDTLRMFLLAPDFLEARAKFAGQAATRYGGEQRMALALGAVTLYMTARILNKLIDDDYHWDLEHAFTLRAGKHDYSLRTVQGDIIHLITDPNRFARNRLNPLYGRTGLEALTQRNYRGEKVDWVEQLKDLASQPIPISLRTSREQKLWESFMSAFAVQTKHGTAQYDVSKLTNEFLKKTGQERLVEVIEDSDSPYRKLRFALADKSQKAAQEAIAELRKRRTNEQIFRAMENSFSRPFTGSWENEFKFRKTLSPEQLRTYQKARKEKEDDWRFFLSVWK